MTERNNGLPPKDERSNLLEMPSEAILKAEADRNYYESTFIFAMTRTEDMPEELMSPADNRAYQQARIAQVKQMLTAEALDSQKVIDEIDMKQWAESTTIETSVLGVVVETVPVEEYQMENYVRSSANIVVDKVNPEAKANTRRGFIKHFKEAKKMSEERNMSQEDIFNNQQLYFELVRRSTSPEEVISQTKEFIKLFKATYMPLVQNEHRTGSLVANADNETKTVDDIERDASKFISNPKVKSEAEKEIIKYEEYMLRAAFATIERYWGSKIAKLLDTK